MSRKYTNILLTVIAILLMVAVLRTSNSGLTEPAYAGQGGDKTAQKENGLQLGNFSVSLTVEDIAASRAFYEKLGFTVAHGVQEQNWLIMKKGDVKIGLFQGMFEKNILTFNPGWDSDGNALPTYTDIREIQRQLKTQGMTFTLEADEKSTGPASFMLVDPDGNPILFDQFI